MRGLVRCSHVPLNAHPLSDLATPLQQMVSLRTACRLRRRASRAKHARSASTQALFPWNQSSRRVAQGKKPFKRTAAEGRAPCHMCNVPNSRSCYCGATFAHLLNGEELARFKDFVRSPSTPIYYSDDPQDQSDMKQMLMEAVCPSKERRPVTSLSLCRSVLRVVAISAISGRPSTLRALLPYIGLEGSDAACVSATQTFIGGGNPFFRGGQPHGGLSLTAVHTAIGSFLDQHIDTIAAHLFQWVTGDARAVRSFVVAVKNVAVCFSAGDYWSKRCLEILLLASPEILPVKAADLDAIIDIWPIGSGTRTGVKRIFPKLRGDDKIRAALRVLQRSLGGGQRQVSIVQISALCCFYHREAEGSIAWKTGQVHTRIALTGGEDVD